MSLIAAVAMMMGHGLLAPNDAIQTDYGIAFPSPNTWIAPGILSNYLAIAAVVATAVMMVYLNRRYNLLRTLSLYFAGLYLIMMGSVPGISASFNGGLILPIVVFAAMTLIYGCYDSPHCTRQVYLAFCLLGAGALVQYGFVLYIPVFVLALAQMRILKSLPIILATIFGIITPAWIVWGLGLSSFHVPHWEMPGFSQLFNHQYVVPAIVTLVVGVTVGFLNIFKLMAYNAHARANNGVVTVVWLGTMVFTVADFTNMTFYLSLLCSTVAFQMGHFFRLFLNHRAYIAACALFAFYITSYFVF